MNVSFFSTATDVILEAEVAPPMQRKFESQYFSKTSVDASSTGHYQKQPNKWGTECRIYFNADPDLFSEFQVLGIDVEHAPRFYYETREYRVNSVEFFWALIDAGYNLGDN